MNKLSYIIFLFAWAISTDTPAKKLKVMSYNIRWNSPNDGFNHWDNRKASVAYLILNESPDFIGMQEVVHGQLIYLDSILTDYTYIGVGREDGQAKGEYSPIFYRRDAFTLLQTNTFWLSETPGRVSVGWDAALERICTYGQFENRQSGQRFWIFNTHFDHVGTQARKAAAALIIQKIKTINNDNAPVILTGDFNLTPETETIKALQAALTDSGSRFDFNPEQAATFNGFDTLSVGARRIDYIFSKGVVLKNTTRLLHKTPQGGWASDHHPVLAEFEYPQLH